MNILELIQAEYISLIFGGIGGIFTAWLTQRVLNKRGIFSYYVVHNKVGASTQDVVFGDVSVTWNNKPIQHLFLSTVELKNESLNDYENVVIRTYTDDTLLLTESSQIINTPNIIEWSEKYKKSIYVESGQEFSEIQRNIYLGQREYLIPVFNRGDSIKVSYLNAAKSDDVPNIWLAATIKGVRVKYRKPHNKIVGVAQPLAALNGALIGLIGVVPLVMFVSNAWIVAVVALVYGFSAIYPGAYAIKLFRKIKELIGS